MLQQTTGLSGVQIEQQILGAFLLNGTSIFRVISTLQDKMFSKPEHQAIYAEMVKIQARGGTINKLNVAHGLGDEVHEKPTTPLLEAIAYSASQEDYLPLEEYAENLHENWQRAEATELFKEKLKAIGKTEIRPEDVLGDVITISENMLDASRNAGSITNASGLAEKALNETAEAYKRDRVVGVPGALPEIEYINQGPLEPGNLYGLVGGTKEGKSSLTAMQIRKALDYECPVLVLSYDQTGVQWMRQMAAQKVGIDANKQRKGEITPEQYELLSNCMREFGEMPLEVIKCGQEGPRELVTYGRTFLRQFQFTKQIPLIILDHVGKVTPLDPRADAGKQAGQSNQIFKAFAGDNNSVWWNLVQRNGHGMSRNNPRPIKRDVHGGEGAVADYDALFYIYREEKWRRDQLKTADERHKADIKVAIEARKGLAELGLVVHRFAPEHVTKDLRFRPHLTLFESLPEDTPQFGF